MSQPETLNAASLFSNCGAGDVGYKKAGFTFRVLAEIDRRRLQVAGRNHPEAKMVVGDLRTSWGQVVEAASAYEPIDLLSACPPCQGMSTARADRGFERDPDAGARDTRNLLVASIAAVARGLKPRLLVVENVPAFLGKLVREPETGRVTSAAQLLVGMLEKDYKFFPLLVDLADYGVPQTRKRAFLTFVRRTEPCLARLTKAGRSPYPIPEHARDHGGADPVLLKDALARFGLPTLDAATKGLAHDPDRPLHRVPVWSRRTYDMVAAIPPNSGGSAWQSNRCGACGAIAVADDDAICPLCQGALLRPVVLENGRLRLIHGFRRSSYRRMHPDRPAATVTTASGRVGSDRTLHPAENRVLSILECALLQTFPSDFTWGEDDLALGDCALRQMVGEAVPPLFTALHGEILARLLRGGSVTDLLSSSDRRCTGATFRLSRGVKNGLLFAVEA